MPFDKAQHSHQALRAIVAERTQPLLAWIGAGMSSSAGLPGWGDLRVRLVSALESKASTLGRAGTANHQARTARSEDNLWIAFEILKKALGPTTFRDEVREALKLAPDAGIPRGYDLLAQLRLRGVLNLNLDRLVSRAFGSHGLGDLLVEHSGKDIARLHQVLTEPSRFVGNLHGTIEDSHSWVFTKKELDALLADTAYQRFISTALSTNTVIFLGITTDDLAIGGHLEVLSRLGIETPTHFWITHRTDAKTDFWSEQVGVRVIRYDARDDDHSGFLECLEDLVDATPTEERTAPPVALGRHTTTAKTLPPPEIMETWSSEKIRLALNAHATELLEDESQSGIEAYEDFCRQYDSAIYRAWYVSTQTDSDTLLGYKLEKEAAKGAFGRVYRAINSKGEPVAIKILLETIRNESKMLHSFRRGVRSMRILGAHGVDGMVAYTEASEIPAFVVMEWVDGPNLTEAKESGYMREWHVILPTVLQLSMIIRRAHALPERVLHRDIRPANVMLKDYYTNSGAVDVVVLDFDLSWHRNAFEVTVLHSAAAGYLAPEQLRRTNAVSTRNAAVDSFGLGMTFLYLCTGVDPLPDEHRHENWIRTVEEACRSIPPVEWVSLPMRFARLIVDATQDHQSSRLDISEIEGELRRLCDAVESPGSVVAADLLAEELAANTECMSGYTWNRDRLCAEKLMPTGLRYTICADLQEELVRIQIEWAATGSEPRQNLEKYVSAGAKSATASLRAAGWRSVTERREEGSVHISGNMAVNSLRDRLATVGKRLDRAVEVLRFGS